MSEFVLGTGQKQTLRNILRLIEANIVKTEGVPKRIRIWTDKDVVEVRRPELKGDWEHYDIVLPRDAAPEDELRELANAYPDEVDLQDVEYEWHLVSPRRQRLHPACLEAINKLSIIVSFPRYGAPRAMISASSPSTSKCCSMPWSSTRRATCTHRGSQPRVPYRQ